MVGPGRKGEAVAHLEGVLEVSQRRACEVIVQPRSTQRYRGCQRSKDGALAAELRRISAEHPRAGYRMATALLRRAGMEINAKRVQRLWRQEGLKVPRRQRKRQRLGSSESGTQRLRAERINQVWSCDFVFDRTEDGRRLKWLPICDEFSRELVALEVERRMEAKDVIRILDEAVIARGSAPEFIRSDNGPEFVALAVQDWIARRGFKTLYIKPGSPWQNAYSESFNSRFRDEFLNREAFASVLEAKVLGRQHRQRHNHERPHSSLDYQTLVEFAQPRHLIMDRAYEGDETKATGSGAWFHAGSSTPSQPPLPWEYDRAMYRRRNEVERLFRRLKGFRRIFSRFDKLDVMFTSFIHIALSVEALRSVNTP